MRHIIQHDSIIIFPASGERIETHGIILRISALVFFSRVNGHFNFSGGLVAKTNQPFIAGGWRVTSETKPWECKEIYISSGVIPTAEGVFPSPINSPFILRIAVFAETVGVKRIKIPVEP